MGVAVTSKATGPGVQKFDGMPAEAAVLRSWMDPGRNPEYHRAMQAVVRDTMPLLGRALDRMVEERGHEKYNGHRSGPTSLCAASWADEDGYEHMCILDADHERRPGKNREIHQCRCWVRQQTAVKGAKIIPSPVGGACPKCGGNLSLGDPVYQLTDDHRYAHAHCPKEIVETVTDVRAPLMSRGGPEAGPHSRGLAEAYAEEKARAQMCKRYEAGILHENVCRSCKGGKDWHSESAIAAGASELELPSKEFAAQRCDWYMETGTGKSPGVCGRCGGLKQHHRPEAL